MYPLITLEMVRKAVKYFSRDLGEEEKKNIAEWIGGYESAWLADLVAVFVLENTEESFEETIFDGIYRDDGLIIFKGTMSKEDVIAWLGNFQTKVNALLDMERLQFTAEVWGKEKENGMKHEKVKVIKNYTFPFLDREMSWSKKKKLLFGVHLKEYQALKYLNTNSQHTQPLKPSHPASSNDYPN